MEQGTPLACRECGEYHSEVVQRSLREGGIITFAFRRVAGPCPTCGEAGDMIESVIMTDDEPDDIVSGCRACTEWENLDDVNEDRRREWVAFLRDVVYPRLYSCPGRRRKTSRRWLVGKRRG